jgi:hypothetical protein
MPREEESCRGFALGKPTGMVDGIDVTLLDPEDEGGRRLLILADHPDLQQAITAGKREVKRGGEVVNPELHLQMHLVLVNQLWDDTPPETWDTAKRLTADGYERHEVLHMLASVVSADVFEALQGRAPDARRTLERLAALPADWEERRAGLVRSDTPTAPSDAPRKGGPGTNDDRRQLHDRRTDHSLALAERPRDPALADAGQSFEASFSCESRNDG